MAKILQGVGKMLKIHSWRTASLAMALTAIVGLALPAPGDDGRPFRGHEDAVIISARPVADVLLVTITTTGQATHLGRFTRLTSSVFHADGSSEGTSVFTAANGDQLFAEFEAPPISHGTLRGTGTFTGGTGRFSDASGGAYFVAVFAPDGSPTVDFGGIIQY